MTDRTILARKEQFQRELASYRGDDPLKLKYEFLLWLDGNYGKDKVLDIFTKTLEETLSAHWNDVRYKDDNRFIELQMIHASVQPNPVNVYQSYYDRGVALQSSILYISWANQLAAAGDYSGADKIFKLGVEKTSSSMRGEVNKSFEQFLVAIGRKFLDGELAADKEAPCSKCRNATPSATATLSKSEDVEAIEMNPGKAGVWDDFTTLVAYFDPPDSHSVRMYPKDKVYAETGKEYSLEEVKARDYDDRRSKKELELKNLKEKELEAKKPKGHNALLAAFDDPMDGVPPTTATTSAFPTPLLHCSGKEDSIATQSFTTRTKMAMHLVQDMWSSPTPDPPLLSNYGADRENKPKSHPMFVDDPETPKAAEKKSIAPFAVFKDSPNNENRTIDKPAASGKKALSTAKKGGLQSKGVVLSERKLKPEEVDDDNFKPVVKHLFNDNSNDILINKFNDVSVTEAQTPYQPFAGIKPLFPEEQGKDDFSDVTCNTKAFNFALPSSTPVQQKKNLAPYLSNHQNSGSCVDERPTTHTQQNLSVILEASKERCSSSGSSTGCSQPRTPAFPSKKLAEVLQTRSEANRKLRRLQSPRKCASFNGVSSVTGRTNGRAGYLKFDSSTMKVKLPPEKLAALAILKHKYFHSPQSLSPSPSPPPRKPTVRCSLKGATLFNFLCQSDWLRTRSEEKEFTPLAAVISQQKFLEPGITERIVPNSRTAPEKPTLHLSKKSAVPTSLERPVAKSKKTVSFSGFHKGQNHEEKLFLASKRDSEIVSNARGSSRGSLRMRRKSFKASRRSSGFISKAAQSNRRITRAMAKKLGAKKLSHFHSSLGATMTEKLRSVAKDQSANDIKVSVITEGNKEIIVSKELVKEVTVAQQKPTATKCRMSLRGANRKLKSRNCCCCEVSVGKHLRTPTALRDLHKGPIVEDCKGIDPFCPSVKSQLLGMLNFPQSHHVNSYHSSNTNIPAISKTLRIGHETYTTYEELGKGAYARVLKATTDNTTVALKIEKPACKWEYYIAKEIQRRVDPKQRGSYMEVTSAHVFLNGSILITEWAKYGSLLNVVNQYTQKTGKGLEPVLSLRFSIEITSAVEYLHKCKIIHGDIKPDNFVLRCLPTASDSEPCLMMIDFGRSIDMSLFAEGTTFDRVVKTDEFTCVEMQEGRPWSYQTDLYCLAASIYCLLIGNYMKVAKKNNEWKLSKVLPRHLRRDLWDPIFTQLINVPSSDQLPNLTEIRTTLEKAYNDVNNYVKLQNFNHLSNILLGK